MTNSLTFRCGPLKGEHHFLIDGVAAQLMCPMCLTVIIMSCVPVGVAGRELKQPQLGCSLDSPTPLESFPATHEWSHLLKMSFIIVHLKLND